MSGSTKSNLHGTQLVMRPYPGSSTPRQKKWRQLAGAGSRHMPGKLGGRAPGKILDRLRFPAKSCQSDLGDEFPKPEHGGGASSAKQCHHPRSTPVCFKSLVRDRYQFDCGAFTV